MGSGRWDGDDWKSYATSNSYASKTTHQIFATDLNEDLDPKKIKLRESVDSKDNPRSTPVIVGLDVTGSMHPVLGVMAKAGLNTLCTEIYNRKPITDPHIMCMGIGDVVTDQGPLQCTQFEADIRIAEQLEKLWLEEGGGGNGSESYALAWYFAENFTKIDSFEKRQKKGYLFTIGDDGPTPELTRDQLKKVFGKAPEAPVSMKDLLTQVSRKWEVFHLVVVEGDTYSDHVMRQWKELLGERALKLSDHTKLGEVIVSTIQVMEGADHAKVADSWDGTTAIAVRNATKALGKQAAQGGIVTL